jgi:hypothetical protein
MEGGIGAASTVAIFAALMYDIVAAACSSPQTTEINADTRADTLMKWVYLGLAQGTLFAGLGMYLQAKEGKPIWAPALGSGVAGGLMYASYIHARQAGLASSEPGTENW